MTILELKNKIKDLPDNMPVVCSQNDNPDLGNCNKIEVISAYFYNDYGYDYSSFDKHEIPVKVAIVNAV